MSFILGFDASNPPTNAPAGMKVAFGYIGGHTPHVWTAAEWARFNALKKVPIYVPGAAIGSPGDPMTEAFDALEKMFRLGVAKGSPLVWDLETAVNSASVNTAQRVMNWAGYKLWPYGSASTLFGNPQADGYWVADFAGVGPFMFKHAGVRATQYASGQQFDSSTVKQWQYTFTLKKW
jgi:hypothetical protein